MRTLLSSLPEWLKAPLRHTKKLLKKPNWVKASLRSTRNLFEALLYYRNGRYCPVCGRSSSRFEPFGIVPREDAQCIHCGALERHRLLWLFLQRQTDLFDGRPKKMLHVAAEPCIGSIFKKRLAGNYLTADLYNSCAMVKMDICDIQFADQSFDIILCNHVLEHVLDDKKAMREFFRVLKKGCWAILNVPINSGKTFEESSIVDPKERLKAFGQEDHVRRYGSDYVERLRDSGFTVKVFKVGDIANKGEAERMGLATQIHYCTK